MNTLVRIRRDQFRMILTDLERPHPHASERVGFLFCRTALHGKISLAYDYVPVADRDYVVNPSVGACISGAAIRSAMQHALDSQVGCFHIHSHGGRGEPWFSLTDLNTAKGLTPSFQSVSPDSTHGAIVLSQNSGSLLALRPGEKALVTGRVSIVGYPSRFRGGIDGPRAP
jgi:hypothetical protein